MMNYATGLLLMLGSFAYTADAMNTVECKLTTQGRVSFADTAGGAGAAAAPAQEKFSPPKGCIIINRPFLLQSTELAQDDFENCIEVNVPNLPVFYPSGFLLVGVSDKNILRVKASPATIHVLRRLLTAGICDAKAESDNLLKLRQKMILKDQDRELFVELKALLKELNLPVQKFFVDIWNDVRGKLSERKQADAEVAAIFGVKIEE